MPGVQILVQREHVFLYVAEVWGTFVSSRFVSRLPLGGEGKDVRMMVLCVGGYYVDSAEGETRGQDGEKCLTLVV